MDSDLTISQQPDIAEKPETRVKGWSMSSDHGNSTCDDNLLNSMTMLSFNIPLSLAGFHKNGGLENQTVCKIWFYRVIFCSLSVWNIRLCIYMNVWRFTIDNLSLQWLNKTTDGRSHIAAMLVLLGKAATWLPLTELYKLRLWQTFWRTTHQRKIMRPWNLAKIVYWSIFYISLLSWREAFSSFISFRFRLRAS